MTTIHVYQKGDELFLMRERRSPTAPGEYRGSLEMTDAELEVLADIAEAERDRRRLQDH